MLIRPWGKQIFHSLETSTMPLEGIWQSMQVKGHKNACTLWPCHLILWNLFQWSNLKEEMMNVLIIYSSFIYDSEKLNIIIQIFSNRQWINKTWNVDMMEYYLLLKMIKLLSFLGHGKEQYHIYRMAEMMLQYYFWK